MALYVAGVNHNDPLGKGRLRDWLATFKSSQGAPPAYVAVVYDKLVFPVLRSLRPRYRELARNRWRPPEEVLSTLEQSLGYEVDAHKAFFLTAPVIWLDPQPAPQKVDSAWLEKSRLKKMLDIYDRYFNEGETDTQRLLECCSRAARTQAVKQPVRNRESELAQPLLDKVVDNPQWAIAIMGATRASISVGYTCSLLQAAGHRCCITDLS